MTHPSVQCPTATAMTISEAREVSGQGCGVGVETGVGVGRSEPFPLESESKLESGKFGRLRLRPGVIS